MFLTSRVQSVHTMICKVWHFLRRVIWVSPLTPVWMSSSQNLQDNYKVSIFMLHFFPTKTKPEILERVCHCTHLEKQTKPRWKFPLNSECFQGPQISLYNWVDHKLANEQEPEAEWSTMPRWCWKPSSVGCLFFVCYVFYFGYAEGNNSLSRTSRRTFFPLYSLTKRFIL